MHSMQCILCYAIYAKRGAANLFGGIQSLHDFMLQSVADLGQYVFKKKATMLLGYTYKKTIIWATPDGVGVGGVGVEEHFELNCQNVLGAGGATAGTAVGAAAAPAAGPAA